MTSTAAGSRASHAQPDQVLVAAVRAGDDRAFELLYARYHRRIAVYVQGLVGDHSRAEDVTQEVFIAALRRMRATERPLAVRPWLYEIAKNACIDAFRRARRADEVSFDVMEGLGAADYGRHATPAAAPEATVHAKWELARLCSAIGVLSEPQNRVLVLREFDGLSYREIGERMGMSRPSVESTLWRARRRLFEEYDDLATGRRCRRVQASIAAAAEGVSGLRESRRLARHLSHCRHCRQHARSLGVDPCAAAPPATRSPVRAALGLSGPLPLALGARSGSRRSASGVGEGAWTGWEARLAQYLEPLAASWGKAVATLAAVLAGVGAGVGAGDRDAPGPSAAQGPAVARAPEPYPVAASAGGTARRAVPPVPRRSPESGGARAGSAASAPRRPAMPAVAPPTGAPGPRLPAAPLAAAARLPRPPSALPAAVPATVPSVPSDAVPPPPAVAPLPVAPPAAPAVPAVPAPPPVADALPAASSPPAPAR